MSEINLNSLKSLMIFKTLYETGTATRTAKDLGITQSGVSRSLALLEENIGMPLFIRHKKRLIPAPEADELYHEILALMGNLEEMKHSIVALREFGASRIRISSAPGLGFAFVPQVISSILEINPNYNISFDILPTTETVRAVEAGHFDVGFVTLPVNSQTLLVEEICKVEAVCLIPANNPLAGNREVCIADLDGQRVVIPNKPNLSADQLLMQINESNVSITGKIESNIAAICSLVGNGVGISLMNPITAHGLADPDKVIIRPFKPAFSYSFGLVYKRSWSGSRLVELIKENLPDIPDYSVN